MNTRKVTLDERLSLAAGLYDRCCVGADIGTDHGMLPCYLLENNICERMILCDISPDALQNAKDRVHKQELEERVSFVCASGLKCLTEKVDCVSITGMGGRLIAEILREDQQKLQGAALVLSAHTDLHLVRKTLKDIGYMITHEELCKAAGRMYLVWKAVPGKNDMTEDELELFTRHLHCGNPDVMQEYLLKLRRVYRKKLSGLESASVPDAEEIKKTKRYLVMVEEQIENGNGT